MCIRDRTTGDPVVDVSGSHTAIRKATEFGNNDNFNSFPYNCLLYTSDAADERSSVDLGGRRIITKK